MSKKKRRHVPSLSQMLKDNQARYGDDQPRNPFTDPESDDHRGTSVSIFEPSHTAFSPGRPLWEDPSEFDDPPARATRLTAGPREGGPRPTSARERKARRAAATAATRGAKGKRGRRAA